MNQIRRVTLPIEDWPAADRTAWSVAIADGDIFDGRGPAAHWRPASRKHAINGCARWLGWLRREEPAALDQSPADRVTSHRLHSYVAGLQATLSPSGAWNEIKGLYDALRVMVPDHDWAWMKRLKMDLERHVRPRDCRDRIIDTARVYELGLNLMDGADLEHGGRNAKIDYRDGLLIALLAARPLRRRNIAAMRIDQHLVRIGDQYVIVFEGDETKTGEPIEFALPIELCIPMTFYLDTVRACFPGAEAHDGLWASMKGRPMSGEAIYDQVRKRTRAAFGVPINLHQFRHNLATFVAYEFPEHASVVAGVLQHRDYRTTERHYVKAGSVKAGRTYRERIARRRQALAAQCRKRK